MPITSGHASGVGGEASDSTHLFSENTDPCNPQLVKQTASQFVDTCVWRLIAWLRKLSFMCQVG